MEDAMFPQREPIKPMMQSLGLSNAPTTLAVLGMSLAKSLGYSPLIGGIAGAMLGGVILVIADQTRAPVRPPFSKS
ncbi:hypothetical protein ACNFX6_01055 [Acinetobacter johnsonii]|uniref:hypothetical protein n=1 Tax=Acinetobacter johnsonii TaxID=40214 RepID=UPI003CEC4FF4